MILTVFDPPHARQRVIDVAAIIDERPQRILDLGLVFFSQVYGQHRVHVHPDQMQCY